MIDKGIYEEVEAELRRLSIKEEAEDVFLELSEILADKGIIGKEVHHSEKYGKAIIEACGICTRGEEDPEDVNVLLQWIRIGKKEFKIEDYFL